MGWMETCAVDERMRFVMAVEQQEEAFAVACRRFGVSRKTGYKWLARYETEGVAGLVERSRAPLKHPQEVSAAIAERCLAVRRVHPTWGPVKVRAWLERRAPEIAWPALGRTVDDHAWPVVDAAFREFGLPKALRSDNGPPFASRGVGGLSKLSVKVIKAGVVPERIAPGKPQQNGRLERLHLTLLQDTANPPARSLRQQLERFQRFQRLYNEERPHEALGNDTPAEHYAVSARAWDGVLREPEYGDEHAVRRVRHNGEIKWHGETIYIGSALIGEPIGLVEDADRGWTACYGPIVLGVIAHGSDRLRKPRRRRRGLVDNASALPTSPQAQQQQQPQN